jgi:hypothetical protein
VKKKEEWGVLNDDLGLFKGEGWREDEMYVGTICSQAPTGGNDCLCSAVSTASVVVVVSMARAMEWNGRWEAVRLRTTAQETEPKLPTMGINFKNGKPRKITLSFNQSMRIAPVFGQVPAGRSCA